MTSKRTERTSRPEAIRSFWPLTLLVAFASILISGACGRTDSNAIKDSAVKVDKEAPQVEVKILSADQSRARAKSKGEAVQNVDTDAYTEWFYSCKADLETEDVGHDDTSGASTVALKVNGIKFKLALPITIYLPANAKAELKEHEDGHVQICSIIYGRADSAALEAGRQVLGRTFNGMGKNLDEARHMALGQAQHVVAQCYHEGTANLADQASQKYEMLCLQYAAEPKMSRQTLAREACKRVLDIPVQIIK
jgi:hypothetical protein